MGMDVRSLKIREEVKDLQYEPAVDLGNVVKGVAPEFILNPALFFERTYLTESMKELIIKVFMNLLGLKSTVVGNRRYEVSSNLILLPSDLGGGKTHTLILLYHIFKLIGEARDLSEVVNKIRVLDEDLAEFISKNWTKIKEVSPKVTVIDCKYSDLAPSPVKPISIAGREIKTLWGYLGYELGRYEFVKEADERETAPYVDMLLNVLNESRAVVLIDEIGRYYDLSGLSTTTISAFLMNLAEAVSGYTVSKVAVVISVPYEVVHEKAEAKAGMEYIHRPELINAINKVLSRPNVEIIKPVERRDLAEILRKRIFAHSREEFDRFAGEFITAELSKEYPRQVSKVLDDKGFWGEVRKTYPFHPRFLEVLEMLAYRLPYLQRTRDAIKIAVRTVLAIKEGLFDWLEDEINLVMPYHIPLFVGEVLEETVLRNAPKEYKVFQLILRSNVVEPVTFGELKKLERKEDFYERVVARALRNLSEEDRKLGVKLASVIWLHSLVGLGIPMNMGDFPTTADLVYSVSPTELDVKGVLSVLRGVLPQLIVHGDPESDAARWFFARIPSIEELVEILKKNVTDEMAKDKLARLLEEGLRGRRTTSIFRDNVAVVRDSRDVPREVVESVNPALIIFADKVSKEELVELLKGRNNVVVLAPCVEGIEESDELSPEDTKGIRELIGFKGRSVWEGLLELLRYYVATEGITEAHLKSFVGERIAGGGEEHELLAEDLMKLLKEKVAGKKDYFYKHTWNLINKSYHRVYYYRLGELRYEDGLTIESDKPIAPLVEGFLKDKGLIPSEFRRDNIISIVRDYLGLDPKRDVISVGHLWSFIRTTDRANVPLISYKMFIEAVKDLVRTLDYAVKIREIVLWKPVFDNRVEAEEKSESEVFLNMVREYLDKTRMSWNDVELMYWENVFDKWIKRVIEITPKDKLLKVLDRRGNVLDIRDVLSGFDPRSVIKAGKLFYEVKKYVVEVEPNLPEEIWEKREYRGSVKVIVENFDEEIEVKLYPDSGLEVEPSEFKGRAPLTCELKLMAERAGDYRIFIEIYGKGELLEKRILSIPVKGEWKEREIIISEEFKPAEEGVKVLCVETREILGIPDVIRLAKSYGGEIRGKIAVETEEGRIILDIETSDPRVLETLWSPINTLTRILKRGTSSVDIRLIFREEPELRDVVKFLSYPKLLRFRVKERASGG